jgi:hypothetical protein
MGAPAGEGGETICPNFNTLSKYFLRHKDLHFDKGIIGRKGNFAPGSNLISKSQERWGGNPKVTSGLPKTSAKADLSSSKQKTDAKVYTPQPEQPSKCRVELS